MDSEQKTYGTVHVGKDENVKPVSILDMIGIDGADGRNVTIRTLEDATVFIRIGNPATSERETETNVLLTPDTFKLMMRTCLLYLVAKGIDIFDTTMNNINISDNMKGVIEQAQFSPQK